MKNIMEKIIKRAQEEIKTIVLPEAEDERVLKAARDVTDKKIANIILVGNTEVVQDKATKIGVDISDIKLVDPSISEKYEEYVDCLFELRKQKGLTKEQAEKLVLDPVYYGVLMVKLGEADGLVSGAIHSTADTLRPALQIIKAREGAKLVSSFFLMELSNSEYESEYIFSDCGLVQSPNEQELAEIAIQASKTYELLVEKTPKVAMLSYSTLGSAKSEEINKVVNATNLVKETNPNILIDGELQLDAAIDSSVAALKAPTSYVAGQANTLIFPNLEAGNIGYKLVERFGGANAYGPITQGLAKPVNDLSRGCKSEDIVGAVAITAVQATKN